MMRESTVGLSIARLVNLYSIRLSTNLTGTMDVAVLLGIFEINFGILAVRLVTTFLLPKNLVYNIRRVGC